MNALIYLVPFLAGFTLAFIVALHLRREAERAQAYRDESLDLLTGVRDHLSDTLIALDAMGETLTAIRDATEREESRS